MKQHPSKKHLGHGVLLRGILIMLLAVLTSLPFWWMSNASSSIIMISTTTPSTQRLLPPPATLHGSTKSNMDHNHQHHGEDVFAPIVLRKIDNHNYTKSSSSSILPGWMQEYFQWHARVRREELTYEAWTKHNTTTTVPLLIMQCLSTNKKCGGIADRLKPLPLVILGAYRTKRLLLIRWLDRPCPLETFMVPPPSSSQNNNLPMLDWRVPDWLQSALGLDYADYTHRHIVNVKPFMNILETSSSSSSQGKHFKQIVTTSLQWWDGGEQAYKNVLGYTTNKDKNNDEFRRIYHELFRRLFQPTPPIQQRLQHVWDTTPLKPYQYAVAHYRALWWEEQDPPTLQEQTLAAQNAIQCASTLRPGGPIYFATDSAPAQQAMRQLYGSQQEQNKVVVSPHSELVHLDRVQLANTTTNNNSSNTINGTTTTKTLEDVYPVFVDLWLLAFAKCISFGDGGFGKYGLMLSADYDCSKKHMHRHERIPCQWQEGRRY